MTQLSPLKPSRKYRLLGPGLLVAATGVGAGDLVATLIAGSRFGYALFWAALIGAVLKVALAEGVGRFTLATGRTIFDGWASMGGWARWYFGVYVVIWGFVYGAAAMTATALPLAAAFPVLDLKTWAMLSGVAGAVMVWFGGYKFFEWTMSALVGIMFVTVVGLALVVAPDVPAMLAGLVPMLRAGEGFYTLGLIGGVGGTITIAAYGYWLQAKGWTDTGWMRVMRLDNAVGYGITFLFVAAMLVVGAELLFASGIALERGERGLLDLDAVLRDRFGPVVAGAFLVGFFATAFSSVLGVWNGVSLMFADFYADVLARTGSPLPEGDSYRGRRSTAFRLYLLWLTFPPMTLLFIDRPFGLVVAYGVLGAFFMPFLAGSLLWLLNRGDMPREWRNGWLSNGMLSVAAAVFVVLAGRELWGMVG